MTDPEELPEENPNGPAEPEPKREPPDYTMKKKPFERAPGRKAGKGQSPTISAPLSKQRKGEGSAAAAPPTKKDRSEEREQRAERREERSEKREERAEKRDSDSREPKLVVPPGARGLGSVPTALEGIMATDSQGRSTNEVLGILVEAHIQEADAILGRTRLTIADVSTVTNALDLARHGIGGMFDRPMPRVSEWVLSKLRAMPSVEGKSRSEFVTAWRSAEERLRAEENSKQRRQEKFANA